VLLQEAKGALNNKLPNCCYLVFGMI